MRQWRSKRSIGVVTVLLLFVSLNLIIFYHLFCSSNQEADLVISTQSDSAKSEQPCVEADSLNRGLRLFFCPRDFPCLPRLVPASDGRPRHLTVDSNPGRYANGVAQRTIQEIHRIPGDLDPVHYQLAPLIAGLQWGSNIYGSVAEFGVGLGKFSSLLAQNINTEAGERLFVVDTFTHVLDQRLSMMGRISQYDIFAANLRRFGFDEKIDGPKRMHVHRGTTEDFQLARLKEWQLPLFRLISVNAQSVNSTLLPVLDLAACLLMDGGILVVGGIQDGETDDPLQLTVVSALRDFFAKDSRSGLSPILVAGDKLFIVSGDWSETFLSHIRKAVERLHLRFSDDVYFEAFAKGLMRVFY